MSKLYTTTAVDNLISQYIELGGEAITITEGCLGHGLLVLRCNGYKTVIVTEVFVNHWNSGHKVRFYNKTPKKYEALIEKLEY